MPISKKWSKMTRTKIEQTTPKAGGVYELTSFGKSRPLYIGQTNNLQRRLLKHLEERNPNRFRFKKAGFLKRPKSMEQDLFENYESKYGEIPSWNEQDPRTSLF